MPSFPATRLGRSAAVAALAAAALGLAACSSSGSSSSAPPATSSASAPASSSASAAPKAMNIAYLSFAVDNTYDAPMLAAAQAVASTDGATLKVFDANNNPQTQFDQLQTVISSGQYNGVITQPIVSTGLVTLVQQAIAKGMKVVNMDQILGTSLSTDAPQVTGLSANVTFVPTTIGTQLGQQVVAACASKNLNPCKVGYLYDIKASSLDTAIFGGFSAAIKGSPVQVVTNGQSFFTPTDGESATQTMLQAQPGLNVITGSDQGMEGATVALSTAHKTGQVLLVGYGASDAAIAGVASGAWFSDVAQAPASEGRLAVQALVAAMQNGKVSGAINPVAAEPNGGIVTKATASQFTGEWTG
ncbi:MAG TPA: sugar ABC transporter substrate-binding protein [Trebonia sp.]|nr:sugar ABC transporter substrate-binding protein [Trebonia sp.]